MVSAVFFSGNVPSFTLLETKDTGFAIKCENLFACIFSILACAWQLQEKSYGRLSGIGRK